MTLISDLRNKAFSQMQALKVLRDKADKKLYQIRLTNFSILSAKIRKRNKSARMVSVIIFSDSLGNNFSIHVNGAGMKNKGFSFLSKLDKIQLISKLKNKDVEFILVNTPITINPDTLKDEIGDFEAMQISEFEKRYGTQ